MLVFKHTADWNSGVMGDNPGLPTHFAHLCLSLSCLPWLYNMAFLICPTAVWQGLISLRLKLFQCLKSLLSATATTNYPYKHALISLFT